jgi:cell division protein FtsB
MPAGTATSVASPRRGGARSGARRKRPARRSGSPFEGVRWDRIGRVALLMVLFALLYLYLSAGVRLFTTWSTEHRDNAAVAVLQREHARLARQHASLGRQATLEAEARRLGMIKTGEQPFVITGLPNN